MKFFFISFLLLTSRISYASDLNITNLSNLALEYQTLGEAFRSFEVGNSDKNYKDFTKLIGNFILNQTEKVYRNLTHQPCTFLFQDELISATLISMYYYTENFKIESVSEQHMVSPEQMEKYVNFISDLHANHMMKIALKVIAHSDKYEKDLKLKIFAELKALGHEDWFDE